MIEPLFEPVAEPVRQQGQIRAQLIPAGLLVLEGIAAGAAWRLLIPFFLDHSDTQEAVFAVEGGLAAVMAVAGLLAATAVVLRPSRAPVLRTIVAIVGSIIGAALAWATGEALGAAKVNSYGVLLIWPVVTAVVLFLAAVMPITGDRFNQDYEQG